MYVHMHTYMLTSDMYSVSTYVTKQCVCVCVERERERESEKKER